MKKKIEVEEINSNKGKKKRKESNKQHVEILKTLKTWSL